MEVTEYRGAPGHEQVLVGEDPACGYVGIVAVHSTALGPAVGGTRLWSYPTRQAAVDDALRLSRAMTLKCAVAGLPLGGGKSVIVANTPAFRRDDALRAHGRLIERLGGRYVAGEDVGTTPDDMERIREETVHVGGLAAGAGDPSPYTAQGVVRAMQATAAQLWGSDDLAGRRVAIQGCGSVGGHLARLLAAAGAELVVADVDDARARRVADACGARVMAPEEVLTSDVDIVSPCALGGALDEETVARLRARAVVGAANEQLRGESVAERLHERGIVYVPDFVANAGGVISGAQDLCGWTPGEVREGVERISDTVRAILAAAAAEERSPHHVALALAEERLRRAARPGTSPGPERQTTSME